MFKKIFFRIVAITALFHVKAQAQDSSAHTVGCGFSAAYLTTKAVSAPGIGATASYTPPALFPPSAIDTCGKFRVFYVDAQVTLATGLTGGFAAAGGVGATRRNTMCTVLGYIQSRLDFSNIPAGHYINLLVDTSKSVIHHIDGSWDNGALGVGVPFYNATGKVPGDIINGFVHDYAMSGTDPNPGDYHGILTINFDSVQYGQPTYLIGTYDNGWDNQLMDVHSGITAPSNCEWDLYTMIIHQMGHVLGWFGWNDRYHTAPIGPYTTNFQAALQFSPDPHTAPNPLAPGLLVPLSTIPYSTWLYSIGRIWVNTRQTPHNLPMSGVSLSHLNNEGQSYIYGTRISPGDYQEYVMQYGTERGRMKRTFYKGELETFRDIIGYSYNPTYATDSATIIANNAPWSSKMSYRYNAHFDANYFTDTVAAEFAITNNTGTTLSFNINSDTTLHDEDGDALSVYPGSMVNFRGCGSGGNNHNQLSISPDGKTITYTPRANFYGRAQFGFNLYDGKEIGAFVLYTVDVKKGNNVSAAKGTNLVQNGNFEEGTEVKIRDIAENVNNSSAIVSGYTPGRWGWGTQWADGQISSSSVIRHSYVECEEGFLSTYNYGSIENSFPYYGPVTITSSTGAVTFNHPEAVGSIGDRYQSNGGGGTLYLLLDSVRKCNRYLLECDVYRTFTDTVHRYAYTPREMVRVGFTTNTFVTAMPDATHLIQTYAPYYSTPFGAGSWQHLKIPISYCNDTPSTAMYLSFSSGGGTRDYIPWLVVDNVSLKEVDTLIVKIKDSATAPCMRRLYPDIPNMGCSMSYLWKKISGATVTTVSTDSAIDISTMLNGKYTLTVADGCGRTATDTFTITPCACSPGALLGASSDSVLTGTVSGSLPSGAYYVPSDITISGATTLTAANVLMAPGVTITVAPTAKLTIDSSHLYTCPTSTDMWHGIYLAANSSSSGSIEVKNNSLIEDAYVAINTDSIKAPASGDLISSTNSIYNRNHVDINIQRGYTVSSAMVYPITIKGNVFTARDFNSTSMTGYPGTWATAGTLRNTTTVTDGKPAFVVCKNYAKALCKDSAFSYLCVQIQNVGITFGSGTSYAETYIGGGSTTDEVNVYDNHGYGIHSHNSNTNVQNSLFLNMSKRMNPEPSTSTTPIYGGMGVVAQSDPAYTSNKFTISTSTTGGNSANKFHDCYQDIFTNNIANLVIAYTVITSSHVNGGVVPGASLNTDYTGGIGINVLCTNTEKSCNISNNKVSNKVQGIVGSLSTPLSGATTYINNNSSYAVNPDPYYSSYTSGQYMMQGINFGALTGSGPANTMSVNGNAFSNVYNGITLSGFKATTFTCNSNNPITLADKTASSSALQYGINITNCSNGTVSSNLISTPTLSITADQIYGVNVSHSTLIKVCANTTTNIGRAFAFTQKTPQTGIRWIGNTMNDGYKGFVLGSDIGDQGFTWNYDSYIPLYWYGSINNIWNGYGGAKWHTCGIDSTNTLNSKLYVIGSGAQYPTVNKVLPTFAPFPYFYQRTGTDSSLRVPPISRVSNCDGIVFPQYISPVKPHAPIGPAALMTNVLKNGLGYSINFRPSQWMAQFSLYEMGLQDSTIADSVADFNTFMTGAVGSRFEWLANIDKAFANNDLVTAQSLLLSPVASSGATALSNGVELDDYTEGDNMVLNYTNYYTAYLNYLDSTMTGADTAVVSNLANGCPAKDGAVVYKARVLNQLLTGLFTEYNDDGCLYNDPGLYRIGSNATTVPQNYTLYPNPNNGSFAIRQSNVMNKAVRLKVYNTVGALVYQTNANFTGGVVQVNIGQRAAGLYLVCIDDGSAHTTCLRFLINSNNE